MMTGFGGKVALVTGVGIGLGPVKAFAEAGASVALVDVNSVGRLDRGQLISVGRFAFRGVERPQELFTLDPFWTM